MQMHARSSIALPAEEVRLVETLRRELKLRSKIDVVRKGLRLLKESTDRKALADAYQEAARSVRQSTAAELAELDHLSEL